MNYFGTNLTSHGHFLYDLSQGTFRSIPGLLPKNVPFHVEEMVNGLPKGEVAFYQGGGFTLIAIAGSCVDKRPGTKSVFWVQEIITREQMKSRILENAAAQSIIKQFPFKVNW